MQCLHCGDCCTRFEILELDKPSGVRCEHLTDDNLCSIYYSFKRPMVCYKHDYPGDVCPIGLNNKKEERKEQVYSALQKWATRMNAYEYSIQIKKNKGKKLKQFVPDDDSLILIEACKDLNNGKKTPEEAMSVLNVPSIRYKRDLVMDGGF